MSTYEQYLNIRYAAAPTFRHDGGRLAFLTDITGTAQVWTLDEPLEWPEQLTFFTDRVTFVEYSPNSSVLAFGRDAGGDENEQVFLLDDDGGEPERLSVAHAKHIWGGFSPDGKHVAWSHNGRNGRDFDVYVMDLATRTERMVLEADGYRWVHAWSRDSDALFVGRAESNDNSDVLVVPLDGSASAILTAHEGRVVHTATRPLKNGDALFLTNRGRDFLGLARFAGPDYHIQQGPEQPWDVENLAISPDDAFVAVVRNIDGYSQLELVDTETLEVTQAISLPRGVISAIEFVPGTHRMALSIAGETDTTDIWVVDANDGSTTRWTRSATGGVPRSTFHGPELVRFTSFDGLEISGFLYRPEADGKFPVVIDIHGGPEAQRRPNLGALAQYYRAQGIATFSPNVRGSRGYGKRYMSLDDVRLRMDSVADIKAAHGWLVDNGADPDRIAVYGGSYGGFMVLSAMVTYPELWAAGVDIVGIADFVTFLENTSEYRRHLREAEYGSLTEDAEFLKGISPLTHIDKIAAPLMVIHGRNDPRVPVSEAEQVIAACEAKGLPIEALIYEDEGHGLAKRKNRLDAAPRVLSFLLRHFGMAD